MADAYVGAETGLLKSVALSKALVTNVEPPDFSGKMAKQHEITCMAWHGSEQRLSLATRGGFVKTFDCLNNAFVEALDTRVDNDVIKGIVCLDDDVVATATQNGVVKVWRPDSEAQWEQDVIEEAVHKMGKKARLNRFSDDEDKVEHLTKLKADRQLTCLANNANQRNVVATAGKECELSVWDLNNDDAKSPLFRAKNVSLDKLQLRVPVWTTDLSFVDAHTLATVSRYGHIRLYDIRGEQRRPVAQRVALSNDGKETLTSMAVVNPHSVLAGSARGTLGLYDFRHLGKKHTGLIRKYEGCVGSIRSIGYSNNHFVAVGLDRFLRLFRIREKKAVQQHYLKSRLNCVLIKSDFDFGSNDEPEAKKRKKEEGNDSDEDDDFVQICENDQENEEGDEEVVVLD